MIFDIKRLPVPTRQTYLATAAKEGSAFLSALVVMETREYRYVDKSKWDRGPWDDEPDKLQWQDLSTGLPCLAVRNPRSGNWCGYVGVSQDHPFFERNSDDVDLECHGGLTFSDFCAQDDKEHGICHVPAPGEPDHVWWFGFDCAHAYDYSPGLLAIIKEPWPEDVYRDLDYVKAECASLAQQLKGLSLVR